MTTTARDKPRPPLVLLRRLRRELSAVFAVVAVLSVAVFSALLIGVDTGDRRERLISDLRGTASRAAALMYESGGRVQTEAVADDTVAEPPSRLVVFNRTGTTGLQLVFRSTQARDVDPDDLQALASQALEDTAERGSSATVDAADGELQATAMPWFGENDQVAGAVITLAARPGIGGSPLLVPVLFGAAALAAVLIGAGWVLTGRGLRPALTAITERETFLATAAHELRTPLARLRAGAETIQRAARHDREQSAALASLVTMTDSASHVVNNLLLAARIDHADVPVHLTTTRLDAIAADAEHLDPAVVVDVTAPISVRADPHLLRHALTNLVDNALRHARSGSDHPLVLVSASRRDGGAVLRVTDNGGGFMGDFDPRTVFVSRAVGGTGLGLSLVAWIARAHEADLTLTNVSDPFHGAQIEIVFSSVADNS